MNITISDNNHNTECVLTVLGDTVKITFINKSSKLTVPTTVERWKELCEYFTKVLSLVANFNFTITRKLNRKDNNCIQLTRISDDIFIIGISNQKDEYFNIEVGIEFLETIMVSDLLIEGL